MWDQGALSALCLVGLQLLQTEASDWSLWNAGRPGQSYCSLGGPWGAAATIWSRAGPSSTMAGMSACTLWGRKAEAAIFSSCVPALPLPMQWAVWLQATALECDRSHCTSWWWQGTKYEEARRQRERACTQETRPALVILLSAHSSSAEAWPLVDTDPHACPAGLLPSRTLRTG